MGGSAECIISIGRVIINLFLIRFTDLRKRLIVQRCPLDRLYLSLVKWILIRNGDESIIIFFYSAEFTVGDFETNLVIVLGYILILR